MPARLRDGAARPGGIIGYPLGQLFEEVAFIAYHFHWAQAEILTMEHRHRRRWVHEISTINQRMNSE